VPFSFALFLWVALMAIFGLMALIVVLGLLGGPAFAGYLAATEEQPGWTLVQGICLTVLALYFGWISVHDARVALERRPVPRRPLVDAGA